MRNRSRVCGLNPSVPIPRVMDGSVRVIPSLYSPHAAVTNVRGVVFDPPAARPGHLVARTTPRNLPVGNGDDELASLEVLKLPIRRPGPTHPPHVVGRHHLV